MLQLLVKEDRVEDVRSVLSTLSNPEEYKTHKLRMLASFAASPAMLKLLGWPPSPDYDKYNDQSPESQCAIQSVRGFNEKTLEFNLAPLTTVNLETLNRKGPLTEILTSGWLEGFKLWCKAFRNRTETHSNPSLVPREVRAVLGNSFFINTAMKHPAGEQLLLFLWKDSGLLSYIKDVPDWASSSLRHVAQFGCSVTLATYLVRKGAMIDFLPHRKAARTALHLAACHATAEGAELMRFLLFAGADPEATPYVHVEDSSLERTQDKTKRIRDEKGAKIIQRWLGKSWDDLVEETKHIRNQKAVARSLESEKAEGTPQHQ